MQHATREQMTLTADIVDMAELELDLVDGGRFVVSWSTQSTDWGSVLAWGVGGAIAGGATGGGAGAAAGAIGGAGADYVSQHLHITWE